MKSDNWKGRRVNNQSILFIGVFPPPFGGATVKNELFLKLIKKNKTVSVIDLHEMKYHRYKIFPVILKCLKAFVCNEKIVYGLDSKRLKFMLKFQSVFNKSYKNSIVLVVGGVFHNIVGEDQKLKKRLMQVRAIWVETEGMKVELSKMGFQNIVIFPNPKPEIDCCPPKISRTDSPLKLVFFSQISKEKGVEDIINLVNHLERSHIDYKLDFYGHIVSDFEKEFYWFIDRNKNLSYCGIFDGRNQNVYKKLNDYDVLLFPTHWDTEGVPGILVEAKMAGIAIISSDRSYNPELIIESNKEGFLLHNNYAEEMYEIIKNLSLNREELMRIKRASFASRKRFSINEYQNLMIEI